MCGSVRFGAFEQIRDENRSGGLGKSSKESSEDVDEESREKFGSKCGSGFCAAGREVRVWRSAAGAADTQGGAEAMCGGAEPPLRERAEKRRGVAMVLEVSMVAVTGEVRVGTEGEGGSSAPVRGSSRRRWSRGGRL